MKHSSALLASLGCHCAWDDPRLWRMKDDNLPLVTECMQIGPRSEDRLSAKRNEANVYLHHEFQVLAIVYETRPGTLGVLAQPLLRSLPHLDEGLDL